MAISKIGNLFAANVDSLGGYSKTQSTINPAEAATQNAPTNSSEAAVISSSFSQAQAQLQETDPNRQARVAELKAQVSRGGYKVPTRDVAVSVLRDLA